MLKRSFLIIVAVCGNVLATQASAQQSATCLEAAPIFEAAQAMNQSFKDGYLHEDCPSILDLRDGTSQKIAHIQKQKSYRCEMLSGTKFTSATLMELLKRINAISKRRYEGFGCDRKPNCFDVAKDYFFNVKSNTKSGLRYAKTALEKYKELKLFKKGSADHIVFKENADLYYTMSMERFEDAKKFKKEYAEKYKEELKLGCFKIPKVRSVTVDLDPLYGLKEVSPKLYQKLKD